MNPGPRRVLILLLVLTLMAAAMTGVGVYTVRAVIKTESVELSRLALTDLGRDPETEPDLSNRERLEALLALVGSERVSLDDRNRAIWLLGRMRAAEAEELLQELLVSETCDHETLVCQQDLKAALERVRREDGPMSWLGGLLDGNR